MKLKNYLSDRKISYTAFAGDIGVSAESVRRYACGSRIPTQDVMLAIMSKTDGNVMANDFFDIPSLPKDGPSA